MHDAWIAALDPAGLPQERRADCADCTMCRPDAEPGIRFRPDVKCCGFLPTLPNFLVGAILEDPQTSPASVRARIAAGQAGPLGLGVSVEYAEQYAAADLAFGTDTALVCPHFDGGRCAIWRHRNAVCRTWWCRFEDGRRGGAFWGALPRLLGFIEALLARRCAANRPFVAGEEEAFYRGCARELAAISGEEIRALGGFELRFRLRELRAARAALGEAPLPERLTLSARDRAPTPAGAARLWGWSPYDPVEIPVDLADSLSAFDGRPLAEVLAQLAAPPSLAQLRRLVDAGVLSEPGQFRVPTIDTPPKNSSK